MGLFSDLFLYSLIIPVVPFMLEDDLNLQPSEIQRYTSAMLAVYAGSNIVCCPVAGVLADRLSTRRAPFLLALCCLASGTIMLFLGKSIAILMLARVLQGVSTAFVWTIGLAMCIETVGIQSMGKTMGTITSVIAVGSLSAPFIGGILYQRTGLAGVMSVAIAVIAFDFTLRLLVIEKNQCIVDADKAYGRNAIEDDPEHQPLLKEAKAEDACFKLPRHPSRMVRAFPLLPCLANPSLLTALLGSLMQAILMGSFDSTIAVVAHELFDFDAFQAGVLFLPVGITNILCGPLIGWLIDRRGTKSAAVSSFGVLVPVLLLLRLVHTGGLLQILLYAGLLTLTGVGLAGSGTPSIVEVGAVIERYHKANPDFFGEKGPYAMVYGMNGMIFNAGLTIGPELAGGLKEAVGYGNMNTVLAVLSGITACLCYFYLGGKPRAGPETTRR
ncbi:hypothetical protein PRZ48_014759 [Zasmidium cellare]|uniref:Major facilitator superfamily (MFS) profile domain-containing protein n=1 Tax=Zasmidium cellare TaxID=395010 RepID=A0ABR0DZ55_ZASCE|nr:hypothetical protein PRZ48_014759 [Zasmidium cellare]